MQKYTFLISTFPTDLGEMVAISNERDLYLLGFSNSEGINREIKRIRDQAKSELIYKETDPIRTVKRELEQYFVGKIQSFTTPLALVGSPFQRRVWDALKSIPYGQTLSYASLAQSIGAPTSYRAVAQANGANPFVILVPCHRVINSNGKLGGYSCGIERKEWLLSHERSFSPNLLS